MLESRLIERGMNPLTKKPKPKQKYTMKTIINLTPHPLTIVGEAGTLKVPTSGQIARLAVERTALDPVTIDGVTLRVSRPKLGD